ncbi:magnesium/cobalt transporter CorA [Rossellomorea vietnamensis]|uniref:Magnesium transport protein CorA n=2 Tax=Rossellomorea TaxID=2837508 RepID=A0A5D4KK87_9BACI|nr:MULTISPECIES: magnesium/cobalt transporter CorA [Rossellomorea]TYR77714.1 magnesium/cobalt transporter CorA [Rossellomorea vietnamensis]TYS83453.1 magnesium/cobalt transporter CorA [Rossellomorea aquimaris]
MIRTIVVKENGDVRRDIPLEEVSREDNQWFWVDFVQPDSNETQQLHDFFQFHPLAIEDCIEEFSERPKLDFYDDYFFLLMHTIDHKTLDFHEVNMFVSDKFIVTFHKQPVDIVESTWNNTDKMKSGKYTTYNIMHEIIDGLVDDFFPLVYKIEDSLNQIEDVLENTNTSAIMERLFDIRHDMSKLRRSLVPMRDLMYRILNTGKLNFLKDHHLYYNDVYDHLLKLVEMLESYREFSSDIRDNYLSINSDKMNNIMMTLTVITTIFMPLTFIAGLYGMNFVYMPELEERNGYFVVLGVMGLIAMGMFLFFVKIGWLHFGIRKRKKRRKIRLK